MAVNRARGRLTPLHWAMMAVATLPGPAKAEECTQEKAIYGDMDDAYELRFEPLGSQAAAASNRFKFSVRNTSIVADGVVMRSDDSLRANGMIMFNCPQGDVTGADIRACTIWQGMVYASDMEGNISVLPVGDADAAARLFLPALGPAIRESSIWGKGKATIAPWDVLTLKGCGE